MSLRYRAFICYSRQDRVVAERLQRRLESFRTPRRLIGTTGSLGLVPEKLGVVFRDREELAASADIGVRICGALAQADFLIVVCSPAAARSRWVNAEVETFRKLSSSHAQRVLAVLASGEPGATDPTLECFPPALRPGEQEDPIMGQRHPLAADLRPGRDRRTDAELRLIAALLGVEFDTLKQRDQERRLRRLCWTVAACALLIVGFAGLTGYSLWQRDRANAAAQAAESATKRATSARAEAEKLVDFMVKDLRDKLMVIGKLELLEASNEKLRAYYATVTPGEFDVAMLRRQGEMFFSHAANLRSHKRGAETLVVLETARMLRRRVIQLMPGDADAWLELAETHRFMALQRRDDGDINGALHEIAKTRRHLQRGIELRPGNYKAVASLASLPVDEGEMLIRAGRTAEAGPLLEKSLRELEELAAKISQDLQLMERASAVAWQLGNVRRRLGQFPAAEAAYRRGLELVTGLLELKPDNIFYLRRREQAAGSLGQALLESGRSAEAVAQLSTTINYSRALLAVDPTSLVYQDALATQLGNLAEAELLVGEIDAATTHIRESVDWRERALAAGATDVRSRHLLAMALATWSAIASKSGRHVEAAALARRGVELMAELCQTKPADLRLADDFAYLRAKLALASLAGGDFIAASLAYREAVAQIAAVIARELDNPQLTRWRDRGSWQLGLGSALLQASRPVEAREALEESLRIFDRLALARELPAATYAEERKQAQELLARLPPR